MTASVTDIGVHRSLAHWRAHPIEFIETVLFDPETGRPFKLLRAQTTTQKFYEYYNSGGGSYWPGSGSREW
jgi:hypothetical protein